MQEINLHQPVTGGVRGALSGSSSRTGLLVIIMALSGLWGFAYWQVQGLEKAAAGVRTQQQAQAALSAAAVAQLDALSDEELDALIAKLSSSIDAKARAVSLLRRESGGNLGFSARLRAFGARHVDGLWLEHLTFGQGVESVGMSGSTLAPELVPRYLQSLATDPALKGGKIDEFVIEKPAKPRAGGGLDFRAGQRGLVAHVEKQPETS